MGTLVDSRSQSGTQKEAVFQVTRLQQVIIAELNARRFGIWSVCKFWVQEFDVRMMVTMHTLVVTIFHRGYEFTNFTIEK